MNASSVSEPARCDVANAGIDNVSGLDTGLQFNVPFRDETPGKGRDVSPSADPRRPRRILCIDDDPRIREFMADCLTHFKHSVKVAPGGKQGLELFRTAAQENEPYELVITDLGMPGIDGRQVAQVIKAESPATPVILLTGWGAMMKEDGEITPAVDAVVNKPVRMAELNELILRMATTRDQRLMAGCRG